MGDSLRGDVGRYARAHEWRCGAAGVLAVTPSLPSFVLFALRCELLFLSLCCGYGCDCVAKMRFSTTPFHLSTRVKWTQRGGVRKILIAGELAELFAQVKAAIWAGEIPESGHGQKWNCNSTSISRNRKGNGNVNGTPIGRLAIPGKARRASW